MVKMWTVDHNDLTMLRGGGGAPFTGFVDALIRATGYCCGVGEARILTSLRVNISDGGVDTEVQVGMQSDPTGYLLERTCWQYKARLFRDVSNSQLIDEVNKPYAKKLITEGYAYRLAICDDMPPEKQKEWAGVLTEHARRINPESPLVCVVTASQLASWANRYPAVLAAHFKVTFNRVLFFDAWSRNITRVTPTFVPLEAWTGKTALLRGHIDFGQPTRRVTLPLQGMAGVGKTRLVYEVIRGLNGAGHLVLYTKDDDAENVARSLANDQKTRCILVADECTVTSRLNIGKLLNGHSERVRVICIDNSGERPIGEDGELRLEELSSASVEQVLAENFPLVSSDRRRAYAQLSGGYIRFAADLCDNDPEIRSRGDLGPGLATVQDYYLDRFRDEKARSAIEALSLLSKVGFGEGVSDELEALCELTGHVPQHVRETAAALTDTPGFVARTTRYYYITPEIIARIAFENAWRRWIRDDPDSFLRKIPPLLLPAFQARVASSASSEVRARTGTFFWTSVTNLRSLDLADEEVVDRLAVLINTDPDRYFPRLVTLVNEAEIAELFETKGGLGRHGSRRRLVWTAERLAAIPKYFPQSEQILRRLALAETEKSIGNNATGVWKELFRIQLSGSATPFAERIELLERVLRSNDEAERRLALGALEETLNSHGTKVVGPAIVAGQLVPPDWRPRDFEEFQNCLKSVLSLFEQVLEEATTESCKKTWQVISKYLRYLLSNEMFPTLREMTQRHPVPDVHLPNLLESLEDFLQYECGNAGSAAEYPPCLAALEWLQMLTPREFLGKMKAIVGKAPWHHSLREGVAPGLPPEIIHLAEEMSLDFNTFEQALPYLNSPEAASASLVGEALASLGNGVVYMERIFDAASASGSSALACGYIDRLLTISSAPSEQFNILLDRLEGEAPEIAYRVALSAPEHSRALERTLRLIARQRLSIYALRNFVPGVLFDRMTPADVVTVLKLLIGAGDLHSIEIAVRFVGTAVHKNRPFDAEERQTMWQVLEASAPVDDRADYWWSKALQTFSLEDPDEACRVAIIGLTGEDYEKRNHSWNILSSLATTHSVLVLERIGIVLLDETLGWRLQMGKYTGLFQILPLEAVKQWLTDTGIEGARAVATFLLSPSVNASQEPTVHPLTEYVLTNWGDDESVFERFVVATHRFQMYSGDIAETHQTEADRARVFQTHSLSAIRRWADHEVVRGETQARLWRIRNEERFLG